MRGTLWSSEGSVSWWGILHIYSHVSIELLAVIVLPSAALERHAVAVHYLSSR